MNTFKSAFLKANSIAVPHTLLGIEGLLSRKSAGGTLWEPQMFVAYRDFPGKGGRFEVCISYARGHLSNLSNTFVIVRDFDGVTGPMDIEQATEFWPELAHLVKWHLSSDGEPMHYLDNTLYWAAQGNTEFARKTAKWLDAPESVILGEPSVLAQALRDRLPSLQQQFRDDLAATGLKLHP